MTCRRPLLLLTACAAAFFAAGQLRAQVQKVTGITYTGVTNSANVTTGNITYANDTYQVSTVTTNTSASYLFTGSVANSVNFRRNTGAGNPNTSTVFYQYYSTSGSTATVYGKGDASPTMGEVMLSNDLTQGIRNPFANGAGDNLNSNIERIDFYFSSGYTVQANDALVFFDLENQNNYGDGFRIAAYNAVGTVNGAANAPTNYVSTGLLIGAGTFGTPVAAPGVSNARYLRSTTTNGDNLATGQSIATLDTNAGTLGANDLYLVGILIPLADLGLSVGQVIYGYSLFAGDVNFTSTGNMTDWTVASAYPTNTSSANWGNMDFMGFGATISRPVPEPSTYGAILLGAGLAFFAVRRWRAARTAA